MRDYGTALNAHLEEEVTTLCFCWKIERIDGTTLGFTNHDRDITFGGVTYEAATGFTATAMQSADDLSVDNMDASGMLVSDKLSEQDLQNGLYDNAEIEIWLVNWDDISQRGLERFGTIGEVSRSGTKFKTEIRGYSHILNQPFGRLYQRTCPYVVGDSECKIDLDDTDWKDNGTVDTVQNRAQFTVNGIDSRDDKFFQKGVLTWTSGNNSGRSIDIRLHRKTTGPIVSIQLLYPMGQDIEPGDAFDITAGCDNEHSTCKNKFNNIVNFGGFPFMPGNDFLVSYPNRGEGHDGGSLGLLND